MNARSAILSLAALPLLLLATGARAQGGALSADLTGYQEVPAISTRASGIFSGTLNEAETSFDYAISWNQKLTSTVTQAHIHFGQLGVNGGIVVFLCTNLGNGPVGTQACPTGAGGVSGTIGSMDVIAGAAMQGITAEQFGKVVRALRAGAAYANVHTTDFPGGEIRGQVALTPAP